MRSINGGRESKRGAPVEHDGPREHGEAERGATATHERLAESHSRYMRSTSLFVRDVVVRAFTGWRLTLQILGAVLTAVSVMTGFDWLYYRTMLPLDLYLFPAAIVGFLVPVLLPLIVYLIGIIKGRTPLKSTAFVIAYAEIFGLFLSYFYKAFTGRAHPDPFVISSFDTSHVFHFGILNGGVFWGWPSSHTIVAFSMAAALFVLFRNKKAIWIPAMIYALYIGLSVGATIHWFSDFLAGACMGLAMGTSVAHSYMLRGSLKNPEFM